MKKQNSCMKNSTKPEEEKKEAISVSETTSHSGNSRGYVKKTQEFYDEVMKKIGFMFFNNEVRSGLPDLSWFHKELDFPHTPDAYFLDDPKEIANIIILAIIARKYYGDLNFWWPTLFSNYAMDRVVNCRNFENIQDIKAHIESHYSLKERISTLKKLIAIIMGADGFKVKKAIKKGEFCGNR